MLTKVGFPKLTQPWEDSNFAGPDFGSDPLLGAAQNNSGQRAYRVDASNRGGFFLDQVNPLSPLATPPSQLFTGVVVGMRSAEEVRRNVAAFGADVPAALWADLRAAGLLDERAP